MELWNLFKPRGVKKRSLADISIDDLNRERLTMQNEQRKLEKELDAIFNTERQLKSEYQHAVSEAQKRSIARRIQEGRSRSENLEARATYCGRMLQTVNGLLTVKESAAFFERMGVGSTIAKMDIAEIESFIDRATVEGTLQQEKLTAMLLRLGDGVGQMNEAAADEELADLMRELDAEPIIETPKIEEKEAEKREKPMLLEEA